MQTLGLSESTPRTESRWRALLWPTIRNEWDLDYVTRQGFWICFLVSALTLVFGLIRGDVAGSLFEWAFYLLAAMGIRERSRAAGIAAFTAYLLGALVLQRYTGNGFGILRIVFLALLLSNIRGNWQSATWPRDPEAAPPDRMNDTLGDKLADQLPLVVWPKGRFLFYVLAPMEVAFGLVALFMPRPHV